MKLISTILLVIFWHTCPAHPMDTTANYEGSYLVKKKTTAFHYVLKPGDTVIVSLVKGFLVKRGGKQLFHCPLTTHKVRFDNGIRCMKPPCQNMSSKTVYELASHYLLYARSGLDDKRKIFTTVTPFPKLTAATYVPYQTWQEIGTSIR